VMADKEGGISIESDVFLVEWGDSILEFFPLGKNDATWVAH
jgi:hypothetical protein